MIELFSEMGGTGATQTHKCNYLSKVPSDSPFQKYTSRVVQMAKNKYPLVAALSRQTGIALVYCSHILRGRLEWKDSHTKGLTLTKESTVYIALFSSPTDAPCLFLSVKEQKTILSFRYYQYPVLLYTLFSC